MAGKKSHVVEAALEAVRSGMTVYRAALEYGVHEMTLYRHCWILGIRRPGKGAQKKSRTNRRRAIAS